MLSSLLIGALSGQRALTPIAAVAITAAQDRLPEGSTPVPLLGNKLVAGGLLAVAVAEMVGDKWPKAPNRTVLSGSTARFLTAAAAGASLSAISVVEYSSFLEQPARTRAAAETMSIERMDHLTE